MVSTRTGRSYEVTSGSEPSSQRGAESKKPATRNRRAKDSDDQDNLRDTSGAAQYQSSPRQKAGVQEDLPAAAPDSPPDVAASDKQQPLARVSSPVLLKATPVASKDTPVLHNSTAVLPASSRQTRSTATRSQIEFPSSPPKSPSLAPMSARQDMTPAEKVRVVHHVPLPESPPLRAPPPPACASDDDAPLTDRPSVRPSAAHDAGEPHATKPAQQPTSSASHLPAISRLFFIASLLAVPLLLPALCSWLPASGLPAILVSRVALMCDSVGATSARVHNAGAKLQSSVFDLAGLTRQRAASASSATWHHLTATLPAQLQQQLQHGTATLRGFLAPKQRQQQDSGATAGPYTFPLTLDALTALLPPSGGWADRAADFLQVAETQAVEKRKAAALVLAGHSAGATAAALRSALPGNCVLHIDGAVGTSAAPWTGGALQADLAGFLSSCPAGVVVLDNVSLLPPRSVAVLNNALSEAGGLTQAGRNVPTGRALFILPVTTAVGGGRADDGHGAYERAVKDELTAALKATAADSAAPGSEGTPVAAAGEGAADPTAIISSFRRRLDAVFAVREVEAVLDAVTPDAALVTEVIPAAAGAEAAEEGLSTGAPVEEVKLPEVAAE